MRPIIHKGRLVFISFRYKKVTLVFKDSYQILPSSLKNLAYSFKVTNKSNFPHLFINDNNLNYIFFPLSSLHLLIIIIIFFFG